MFKKKKKSGVIELLDLQKQLNKNSAQSNFNADESKSIGNKTSKKRVLITATEDSVDTDKHKGSEKILNLEKINLPEDESSFFEKQEQEPPTLISEVAADKNNVTTDKNTVAADISLNKDKDVFSTTSDTFSVFDKNILQSLTGIKYFDQLEKELQEKIDGLPSNT